MGDLSNSLVIQTSMQIFRCGLWRLPIQIITPRGFGPEPAFTEFVLELIVCLNVNTFTT